MKLLQILTTISLISCSVAKPLPKNPTLSDEIVARVTYYWPGDSGQSGRKTSTGNIAKGGKTIAVDPRIIPYGSKVHIPTMQKIFVAHDTGTAVRSRKASKKVGKNNIVVDVFCENKYEAYRRMKQYPMFMKIKIEKPTK